MLNRSLQWLLAGSLMTGTLWAADNPFVGKWKVDSSKSKLNDEMQVEAAGANRYALTFGPGQTDTVVADGTDQPALSGTTLALTVKGPYHWEILRKMKGRTLLTASWTLSSDGQRLDDAFTQYLPDGTILFSQPLPNGSTLLLPYVYERTAAGAGFLGTWVSESATVNARIELEVQPQDNDGLSFKRSDEGVPTTIKLDGKDHSDRDHGTGSAFSGRRVNDHSLEITETSNGKIILTRTVALSKDLRSLTVTEQMVGQSKPRSILVFERQ